MNHSRQSRNVPESRRNSVAFTVIIERDEKAGMYVGEVPDLPGCHTQGKSIDELMKNMHEVIELCLEK